MSASLADYAGYALASGAGTEPASGRISFAPWRLKFASDRLVVEIPLVRIEIRRDEGGATVFRDPRNPGLTVYTFEAEVLENEVLLRQPQTRRQISALQGSTELARRLKITVAVLAGFALLALLGSLLTSLMVRSLVARIPVKWEIELGKAVMDEVRKMEKVIQDPRRTAQVRQAVGPLIDSLPKAGFDYQFYLVESPIPNAFALPGGHVIVHTALLDLADRPEELAGVVAHEVAHVTLKHGFRKIISSAGPFLVFGIFMGGGGGALGVLGESSHLLVRQSFSQAYELEADDCGWQYLVQARIDPRGMIDILMKLESVQQRMGSGQFEIQALSSHPETLKRIKRLEAKWKALRSKPESLNFQPLPKA
jgi:predicted Zn-dependent protease